MIQSIKLNQKQKQAVNHNTGPVLIIAGAGTGKTTVITLKIAKLIKEGLAKTNEVLALTFTTKAAEEMETRVDQLLPYGTFDTWISTFHSFCDKILKNHCLDIGLAPDYRLIDTTESWLLLRKNLYKLSLDYYRPKNNPSRFIHALLKLFSRLKDENITPEEYLTYAENLVSSADSTMDDESKKLEVQRIKETADAFFQYQQLLLDNNYLDFGDLIFYTNTLFVQRPNILKQYKKQFKYILIDEFQDTNLAQYQLIKLLTTTKSNLTVVGDDDQAIFKFRGASISNILNFKKDYPGAQEIVLTQNYRSKQNLLDLSYDFIQHNNPDRLECKLKNINKKLHSQDTKKGIIEFIQAPTAQSEIEKIIDKITQLVKNNTSYNDIAILIRANSAAEPIINAFKKVKLPHIYMAHSGLYNTEPVMDILSWAKVIKDREDSVSLSRVLRIQSLGINQEDVIRINAYINRKTKTLHNALENIATIKNVSEETIKKIQKIITLLKKHATKTQNLSATEMILLILQDLDYTAHLLHIEKKAPQKMIQHYSFINQFLRIAEQYSKNYNSKSLSNFTKHIYMAQEAGDNGPLSNDIANQGPDAIKILTIHTAKGLEFKYVFIVNMVKQRFPTRKHANTIKLPDDLMAKKEILPEGDEHLEEERRLFYVALTRAKTGVFLSGALNYGGKRNKKPSRFLLEANIIKTPDQFMNQKITHDCKNLLVNTNKNIKKTKLVYKLPNTFSFSQITAYEKCPLQYKYQFILKIPKNKGKGTTSFGKTMHAVMQEIFHRIKIANHTQAPLFRTDTTEKTNKNTNIITLKKIYQIYDNKWIDDWYESEENKNRYYKEGKKILKEFFEKYNKSWPNPLFLEKPFQVNVGEYILKGRIDRIDKINNNNIEIIDYKTGKFKEKLSFAQKKQLLIYQMALQNSKTKPAKLTFYYLNKQRQGAVSFVAKNSDINKAKQQITDTIQQIQKSSFNPKPNPYNCRYCDFKEMCKFKKL